jgi:exoribonuclease R
MEYKVIDNKAFLYNHLDDTYTDTKLKKLFDGDIINDNDELIQSKVREKYLLGVLSTSATQTFGKNKSGKTIYITKPLNRNLPNFLISYGGKLKGKLIVKFKYDNWDNKLPSGIIEEVLGLYDDIDIQTLLLHHYNIYLNRKQSRGYIETSLNPLEDTINRINYDANIISIDPDDCEDIDDALSLKETEFYYEVGVHIAQPIVWLNDEQLIEKSNTQFSTLYLNDNNINLWGNEVTQKSSLTPNKTKYAYSTIFYFDIYTLELEKIIDFPSIIKNKHKLSYDNAYKNKYAKELMEFTLSFNKFNDYKELVSYWMIKTNNHIGSKYNVPYRVNSIDTNNIRYNVDDEIKKIFNTRNANNAYYSYQENEHKSLGLKNYTHFTSPIRRIIDSLIHYNITYKQDLILDLDIINELDLNTKRMSRQLELDNLIENIFMDTNVLIVRGYIYRIVNDNRLQVYVKDYGLGFVKVKLYDVTFSYLLNVERSDYRLILSSDEKTMEYNLGDLIEIKIMKQNDVLPRNKLVIIPNGDKIINF